MTASARTIALVACSARKLDRRAKARDLYTGALFRASVRFAEAHGWPWFVLSADAVVMLAGAVYRDAGNLCEVLRGCGIRVEVPLAGMGIGSQKRWLRLHTPEPKG